MFEYVALAVGVDVVGLVTGDPRPLAGGSVPGCGHSVPVGGAVVDVVVDVYRVPAAIMNRAAGIVPAVVVTGTVAGAIASPVGIGAIESGAEPRSTVSSVGAPTDAEAEGAGRVAQTETPAIPGVPAHMKAPCAWPGVVVIGGVPGVVVVTGSVDDTTVGHIRTRVARGVADIDDFGGRLIDLDVGDVVNRIRWRDGVNDLRDVVADGPGAV